MINRIGSLPHTAAPRDGVAANLFDRPQLRAATDRVEFGLGMVPNEALAARLNGLAARATQALRDGEAEHARVGEIGAALRDLRGELGRSETTARFAAGSAVKLSRPRTVETTETRPIYATVYTYETKVTGTRDLVGDDDDLEGWDDAGINQGARFTVQVGAGSVATVEFAENERIDVTIDGVRRQFSFEDDEGEWRQGLVRALNSVAGVQARFVSGGRLELSTTGGEALTLANGRNSPLSRLGFSPGTVEQVVTGSEQVQVGTETVRRRETDAGIGAASARVTKSAAADGSAIKPSVHAMVDRLTTAMGPRDDLSDDLRSALRSLPSDDVSELARPENVASTLRSLDRTIARVDALETRLAAHVADLTAAHDLGREIGALLARQLEAPSPTEALALAKRTADALARGTESLTWARR